MEFLKIIFRKKSLNYILFIIVTAIIREALALGFDEGFENLFLHLSNEYQGNNVKFYILLLQLIFTKGSWITLIILFVLLLIFVFLKYKELIIKPGNRPRIDFHKVNDYFGRIPNGITPNNPEVIIAGSLIEKYWDLVWSYTLEIRNNSTEVVYEFEIEFENRPNNTSINVDIGKFQPILPHENKEYQFKLIKSFVGNHIQADEELRANINELMDGMIIIAKYKDENRKQFTTKYNWITDTNNYS